MKKMLLVISILTISLVSGNVEEHENNCKQGESEACYLLGVKYMEGENVTPNIDKAIYFFKKAENLNHIGAIYTLGFINQNNQKHSKSFNYYQKAADLGAEQAQTAVGTAYQEGRGVKKDIKKAIIFYKKAYRKGEPLATNRLAFLYSEGIGVSRDNKTAFSLYKEAESLGSMDAKYNLASYYIKGIVTKQDVQKGINLYIEVANLGDTSSLHNLAVLYHDGEYVKKNLIKAYQYYSKAIEIDGKSANPITQQQLSKLCSNHSWACK